MTSPWSPTTTGTVAGEGRSAATLEAFFDELGDVGTAQLRSISCDMGAGYFKAIEARASHADVCLDPFHVIKLANAALDQVRREAGNQLRRAARPEEGPLVRDRRRRLTPTAS